MKKQSAEQEQKQSSKNKLLGLIILKYSYSLV